ncbi:PAS domain S-box protein [Chryseolinea sp. H1M3-3]|uniref:PAS domain-containing protein n=1 Tax=Chryseolinea sp. H1M3-3 TaxID=3034144 RepID=UPI0023EDF1E4|nr:PAS domain S-box protein [Chryseolinea sp. H1M3-3]
MSFEERKMLIVEDNPGDLFLVKEFIKRTSLPTFEIFHADTVEKAVSLLKQNSFNLILLDLFLSDSEGISTFERIYPLSANAPVIVLTGLIDEKITSEALKKGAQDYLVKGDYDKKLLEKTIRYAIERKQNQELLKQSEEEYKLLFENNPVPMWAYDVKTFKIVTVNASAILCYGYTREEFSRLTIQDILPPENVVELLQNDSLRKTGPWRHKRKDNSIIYVEIVSHDIVLGGVGSRLVAVYDVTERTKVEGHLRLLESVITNANDAVLVTEAQSIDLPGPKIVYVNEAFTTMTGYTVEEVMGKTPRILQGPKTERKELARIREALVNRENIEVEIINYKKNGEEYWANFTIVPVTDKEEVLTHFVAIQRDVTARKRQEEMTRENLERQVKERTRELNEALSKEKELVELKSKFVAIASHEFRTPLATINFATNYLKDYLNKLQPADINKKLESIEKQVKHMTFLLDDVLTLGKSESGKTKVVAKTIDIHDFFQKIVEEVLYSTKSSHTVTFTFDSPVREIKIDEKLLRNVFINLLSNAIKFSPDASEVSLAVRTVNNQLLISVKDSGVGIPTNEFDKIFDPFHRGSNAGAIQGTGLGLSIVKKAVELLEGDLGFKSEVGRGSEFTVGFKISA